MDENSPDISRRGNSLALHTESDKIFDPLYINGKKFPCSDDHPEIDIPTELQRESSMDEHVSDGVIFSAREKHLLEEAVHLVYSKHSQDIDQAINLPGALSKADIRSIFDSVKSEEIPSSGLRSSKAKAQSVPSKKREVKRKVCMEYAPTADVWFPFNVKPERIVFNEYNIGEVHELTVDITNISTVSRTIRILPPRTEYFCISTSHFPSNECSTIAPGLRCRLCIQFAPDTLDRLQDEILMECEGQPEPIKIPILAERKPLVLDIPQLLLLDPCLIGERSTKRIALKSSHFNQHLRDRIVLLSEPEYEDYLKSGQTTFYHLWSSSELNTSKKVGDFQISPVHFVLCAGKSAQLKVVFEPSTIGDHDCQLFLLCETGQIYETTVKASAERLCVCLESIDGKPLMATQEKSPLTDNEPLILDYLHFLDEQHPHTELTYNIRMKNSCNQRLRFKWLSLTSEATQCDEIKCAGEDHRCCAKAEPSFFDLDPKKGLLDALGAADFILTCKPTQVGEFTTTYQLEVEQVSSTEKSCSSFKLINFGLALTVTPLPIYLEPSSLFIEGSYQSASRLKRMVKLVNKSKRFSAEFTWQLPGQCNNQLSLDPESLSFSVHSLKSSGLKKLPTNELPLACLISPKHGSLKPQESASVELVLDFANITEFSQRIPCHLDKSPGSPLWLHVEAKFQHPRVTFDQVNCDFGVIRPGEEAFCELSLTNPSAMMRDWKLQLVHSSDGSVVGSGFQIDPDNGTLRPLETTSVNLKLVPRKAGRLQGLLWLVDSRESEVKEHQCIEVIADVQLPSVNLSPKELCLDDLYVGQDKVVSVTLTNTKAIGAGFSWSLPIGNDAEHMFISVKPSTGVVEAFSSIQILVTVRAAKRMMVTDLVLVCSIDETDQRLMFPMKGEIRGIELQILASEFPLDKSFSIEQSQITTIRGNQEKVDVSAIQLKSKVGLYAPTPFWVEISNTSPIDVICNLGGIHPFSSHCPIVYERTGYWKIKEPNHKLQEVAPAERLVFDWCQDVLRGSAGSRILPILAESYTEEGHLVESNSSRDVEIYRIPGFGRLRFCFLIVADLWGNYQDVIDLHISQSEGLNDVKERITLRQSIHYSVVGCPILFQTGGLLKRIPQQTELGMYKLPSVLQEKSANFSIRFGPFLIDADQIIRKVRLYNSSSFPLRINWQVYADSPGLEQGSLLEAFCFTEPFCVHLVRSGEINNEDCSAQASRAIKGSVINFRLRERDGELIWQTPGMPLTTRPTTDPPFISFHPEQTYIQPHETQEMCVSIYPRRYPRSSSYRTKTNAEVNAIGYLHVEDEQEHRCLVDRGCPIDTEHLRLNMKISLEQPSLMVDLKDSSSWCTPENQYTKVLCFEAGMGDLLDPNKVTSCRECAYENNIPNVTLNRKDLVKYIRVKSCNSSPIRVRLYSLDRRQFGLQGADGEFLEEQNYILSPGVIQKIPICYQFTAEEFLNRVAAETPPTKSNEAYFFTESRLILVASSPDFPTEDDATSIRFELQLRARILRPAFRLFPADCLDFGTVLIGTTEIRELRIINERSTESFWYLKVCSHDTEEKSTDVSHGSGKVLRKSPFKITPPCGILKCKNFGDGSSTASLQVEFKPTSPQYFEETYCICGVLGEDCYQIQLKGSGSLDENCRYPL